MVPTIPALFPAAETQRRCRRPWLRWARVTATAPARPPPRRGCPGTAWAPHIHLPKFLSPQSLQGWQEAAGQAVEAEDAGAKRSPRLPRSPTLLFPPENGSCPSVPGRIKGCGTARPPQGPARPCRPARPGWRRLYSPTVPPGRSRAAPNRADPAPGKPRTGQTPHRAHPAPAQGAPLCPAAALTKPCLSEMLLVSLSL